jgi:hypothetical protein
VQVLQHQHQQPRPGYMLQAPSGSLESHKSVYVIFSAFKCRCAWLTWSSGTRVGPRSAMGSLPKLPGYQISLPVRRGNGRSRALRGK